VRRLQQEGGFGLIELVIAMTILAIGILALVAGLSSAYVSLRRASTQQTASALADQTMERFRALRYADIALNTSLSTDSIYTGDTAYSGTVVSGCSTTAVECTPMRSAVAGADSRTYRVDTYIRYDTPTGGRQLKKITVVVRSANGSSAYARVQSTFDKCTGLGTADTSPCSV
jgi:type IV pilus modification protein PilV